MMKDILLSIIGNVSIQRNGKSLENFTNSTVKVFRVTKDSISYKIEVDSINTKKILSRPFNEKTNIEKQNNSVEWSDRRGNYIFSSEEDGIIDNFFKTLQLCKIQLTSTTDNSWSKLKTNDSSKIKERERCKSIMGGYRNNEDVTLSLDNIERKKRLSSVHSPKSSGIHSPKSLRSPKSINNSPLSPKSPSSSKPFKRIQPDEMKKRGSFLKRRQLSDKETISSMLSSSRQIIDNDDSSQLQTRLRRTVKIGQSFFEAEIADANASKLKEKKCVQVHSNLVPSVYVTQILISFPELFNCSFDKKIVPTQIGRCCKLLASNLDKKWLLYSVISYDELITLPDIESQGIKKSLDPFLASEYLLYLLRKQTPIIVFDNFDPEKSFLEISGNEKEENEFLEKLLSSQPPLNKSILGTILALLKNAVIQESSHDVSIEELAKLFGPYLISPQSLSYKKTSSTKLNKPLEL